MKAAISGTGLYTPEQSISNDELVASFNAWVEEFNAINAAEIEAGRMSSQQPSSSEFIVKASGIKSRFVIDKSGILDPSRMVPNIPDRADDSPSLQCDMSVAAAKQALEQAGKSSKDVDAVIVACSNLQRAYPAVSIEVQNALGIDGFAYDMNVACSSATFGLQAAVNAVETGQARSVLVINPEICTGHLNFRDRDSHFIFGDACTALLVEPLSAAHSEQTFEVVSTKLKTLYSNNIRNNFGFLNRADQSGVGAPDKLFVQQGRKVFKEVVPLVSSMILEHMDLCQIQVSELKKNVAAPSQLKYEFVDFEKKFLGRQATEDEAPVILDTYANTSSAGSVIAFHKHKDDFNSGDVGVLCSFGAGYSAGSVVLRKP